MTGQGETYRSTPAFSTGDAPESNHHRHGRWTGLFKLVEECGELNVVLAELPDSRVDAEPELIGRLCDELGDVGAASQHVGEVNPLDAIRIIARIERQYGCRRSQAVDGAADWQLRAELQRALGVIGQVVGKICAFPDGDEHPDGAGNLSGRLEVALADLAATARAFHKLNLLDGEVIVRRAEHKLRLFRGWMSI